MRTHFFSARYSTIIVVLILTTTLAGFGVYPAKAEYTRQQTIPNGVDMFVLLDQSDSMTRTDPDELRIDTTRYLIDYAAFYAANYPQDTNNIAVIGFGSASKTHVMVPLTAIIANPALEQDPALESIKDAVGAEKLGTTNVVSAFDLVEKQLHKQADASTERQRVLILITDGIPYDDSTGSDIGLPNHFAKISERYNALKSQYPGKWDLVVVGIDAKDKSWTKSVENSWLEFATSAARVQKAAEMKTEIVKRISPILGFSDRTYSVNEDIFVEPYLTYVSLSIFKYSPSETASVGYEDAEGKFQSIKPDGAKVRLQKSNGYELWLIKNPPSGTWRVSTSSGERVDIFKQVQFVHPEIVLPDKKLPINVPFYIRFDLPIYDASDARYPLTCNVTITEPDGNTTQIEIDLNPVGTTFRSKMVYQPKKVGAYHIVAQADAPIGINEQPVTIFSEQTDFSVYETSNGTTVMLSPVPPYLEYEPLSELTLRLTDQAGLPVKRDTETQLNAVLRITFLSGQIQNVPLKDMDMGNIAYQITSPVLLNEDSTKQFELIITDDLDREIMRKNIPINTEHKVELVSPEERVPENGDLKTLSVRLLDQNNAPFIPSSAYNLRLKATIIPVAKASPVTALLKYDLGQQLFTADLSSLPTNASGENRVEITGLVTLNGKDETAFTENLKYTVTASLPYFRVILPTPNGITEYPIDVWGKKQDMVLQIEWVQDGKSIDPGVAFIDQPSDLILVDINGPKGISFRDLRLQQLDPTNPSQWGVVVPGLDTAGDYTATFKFQDVMLKSQKPYMPFEPVTVKFVRVETAFQILVQTIQWVLFGIAMLVLIFFSIRWLNEFREPYPRGVLKIFEYDLNNGKTMIDQINLTSKKRRTVTWLLPNKKLPGVGVQRLVVRHIPGRTGNQSQGISIEAYAQDGARPFSMQFDRGNMEKRIPGRVPQARVYYAIEYTPPLETKRK